MIFSKEHLTIPIGWENLHGGGEQVLGFGVQAGDRRQRAVSRAVPSLPREEGERVCEQRAQGAAHRCGNDAGFWRHGGLAGWAVGWEVVLSWDEWRSGRKLQKRPLRRILRGERLLIRMQIGLVSNWMDRYLMFCMEIKTEFDKNGSILTRRDVGHRDLSVKVK